MVLGENQIKSAAHLMAHQYNDQIAADESKCPPGSNGGADGGNGEVGPRVGEVFPRGGRRAAELAQRRVEVAQRPRLEEDIGSK